MSSTYLFKKYFFYASLGLLIVTTPVGLYFLRKKYIKRAKTPESEESSPAPEIKEPSTSRVTGPTSAPTKGTEIKIEVPVEVKNSSESKKDKEIKPPAMDERAVIKILSKMSENTLINLVMAADTLREEYSVSKLDLQRKDIRDQIANFKTSMIELASQRNLKIFKEMGVNERDYQSSLEHHLSINSNGKIKKRYTAIEEVIKSFRLSEAMDPNIHFPDEIKNNFLKIITNTFYHTLKKVTLQLLSEHQFDQEKNVANAELCERIEKYYTDNLVDVRKRIIKFFNIKDKTDFKPISLVRCYVFTLQKSDAVRRQYEYCSGILNKVEENLRNKVIAEEFVNKDNQFYINDIKDEIIELERLTVNTIDFKQLN